ncbi:MAG TPA: methylthioribulose 1-phosphate dehydratase [Steroidobacteraceae bacterium]
MSTSLDEAVEAIIASGRRLDARDLAPATSGNYSVRLDEGQIAVTVSGRHKGRLNKDDVMRVNNAGVPLENKRPSAETGLHTLLYRLFPQVNAVLHVHSVPVVTLTRYLPGASELVLKDYEMLKAFPGITTHEATVRIPIFENSQNIEALAQEVGERLKAGVTAPVYLIRGHGSYGWGKDMEEAERVIEALEHLLSYEIEAIRLRAGVRA